MGKGRRTYKTKRGAKRGFMRRAAKAGLAGSLTNEELTLGVRVAFAEVEGKMTRAEVDKALDDLLGKAKAGRFRHELAPYRGTIRGAGGGVMMPGPPGGGAAEALTAESRRLLPAPGRPIITPRGPQPQLMAPRRLALPAPATIPPISDSAAKSVGYKSGRSFGAALASGKEGARTAVSRVWSAVSKSKTGRYGLVGAALGALSALAWWATRGEDEEQPAPSEESVTIGAWEMGGADVHQLRLMMGPQMQEASARASEARENLFGAMAEDVAAQRQFSMSEIPLAMAIKADRMRMEAAEEPRRKQEMMEALMIADRL